MLREATSFPSERGPTTEENTTNAADGDLAAILCPESEQGAKAQPPTVGELHIRIYDAIQQGKLKPGGGFPSQATVRCKCNLGEAEVRRLWEHLKWHGIVEVNNSTDVLAQPVQVELDRYDARTSANGHGPSAWEKLHTDDLSPRQTGSAVPEGMQDLPDRLKDEPRGDLVLRTHVRRVGDQPVVVREWWLPRSLVDDTTSAMPRDEPAGLYEAMRGMGISPVDVGEEFTVRPATGRDAERLKIDTGTPVLEALRIARDQSNSVAEVRRVVAVVRHVTLVQGLPLQVPDAVPQPEPEPPPETSSEPESQNGDKCQRWGGLSAVRRTVFSYIGAKLGSLRR